MPSRGMNTQESDLISDPDVGKTFKYHAQYPGVMQGSQEGKRAKLWGQRAHFGANISMKIVIYIHSQTQCRLFLNPYLSCFFVPTQCLLTPVYFPSNQKKQKQNNSVSASVLNSYNFTILRSAFYLRNVCVAKPKYIVNTFRIFIPSSCCFFFLSSS